MFAHLPNHLFTLQPSVRLPVNLCARNPFIHSSIQLSNYSYPFINEPVIHTPNSRPTRPFFHTFIQAIHPSIHPSLYSSIRLSIRLPIHPSMHLSTYPFIKIFSHPSVHPSIHSFIHTFIYSFIRPFIHSLNQKSIQRRSPAVP